MTTDNVITMLAFVGVAAAFLSVLILAHRMSKPSSGDVSGPMGQQMVDADFSTGQPAPPSQYEKNMVRYADERGKWATSWLYDDTQAAEEDRRLQPYKKYLSDNHPPAA